MQATHASERWFRYNDGGSTVELTQLYNWYAGDFKQAAGSSLEFAAGYSRSLKQALESGDKPKIKWLEYDWALNEQK